MGRKLRGIRGSYESAQINRSINTHPKGHAMQNVTAAVIYNNGKVLLTRRAPGEKHAGWWEFPGGKIEEGETPEQCLARELTEELGIETVIGRLAAESVFEPEPFTSQPMKHKSYQEN
jgi:8-oxo-dGTP pyrophosphatase MutT (NUDIX family)